MRILKLSILILSLLAIDLGFAQTNQLTVEDIWYSRTFSMEYVSGLNSMNDGEHYTSLEYNGDVAKVVKYSYETGAQVEEVMNASILPEGASIEDYSFNQDESKMLVASKVEGIYRHSSKADYFIVNLATKRATPVSDQSKGKIRLAEFSPDGKKVAFVRENNLFVQDLSNMTESALTDDGVMNEIINGATDWVYEEEFGFDKGFYWSKGSDYIAYYRFDEKHVKEFQMAMYGGGLYPHQYKFKYPKAGEENSLVQIFVHDLNSGMRQEVDFNDADEYYIPRLKWTQSDTKLSIMKMNRHQNKLQYLMVDTKSARGPKLTPKEFYAEKSDTYIEVNDNLIFLEDGKRFLITSDKDGYNHIYQHKLGSKVFRQLTKGAWDVIDFAGFDEETGRVFYTSSEEGTINQDIYTVSIKGGNKTRLSTRTGTNEANFSNGFKYFILYHSDANTPYRISLHDGNGSEIRVLKENNGLKKTMAGFGFQPKEFFTFTTENGDELNGWMIKPPNFNENKEYPVILAIYGGPGHNTVTNSFGGRNLYWHQMLAQKGYIVASVDPRGTYYRGRDFKNSTYLQLGKLETEDMISSAKYLGGLPYIDKERIGMQGWSFGGYLTSSCMTKGAEYFKMGIAVAPVTNWRYYDTIYTERFMRTPQENAEGYDDNSPINHVDKLKGPYLLVHGSADDNVHYQNTMEMINALVTANKDFDLFIYPDRNHGIYGGTTRLHLYNKMTDFILENL